MKLLWVALVCVGTAALACAGVGGSSGSGMAAGVVVPEPAAGGDAAWQLRALTYNSGLAPDFEPFPEERGAAIEAALADAAHQLDLLCVQEYWDGADFDALGDALESELPERYRQEPKPGTGACTEGDLGSLGGCLSEKCANKTGIELVECAQTQCPGPIQSVDGGCLGCFLDHIDDGAFVECLGDAPKDPALFRGTFDVGLLSRYPILQKDALAYDAYFVRASALYAQVDVPRLGPVDTFCTHLGSSLGVIPYQGPHGSWDGEHAYQTAQLVSFVSAKATGGHPILLLGDLNTGPAVDGPPPMDAELPLDYRLLLSSGLSSAVAEPRCTICSDNALRAGNSREIWLDHALIKGFDANVKAERALTETFSLPMPGGAVPMNLSDHYGLRVELKRK